MRTLLPIVLVLTFLGCGGNSAESAGPEGGSSLGYAMDAPAPWIVLTREEIRDNPDLFDGLEQGTLDPALFEAIRDRILSGGTDFYFRPPDTIGGFTDNINVMKQIMRFPSSDAEMNAICDSLPEQFSAAYGRETAVHDCGFSELGDVRSVRIEFDGVVVGTRSLQHIVPKSDSVALTVTATVSEDRFETLRPELDGIFGTFRILP